MEKQIETLMQDIKSDYVKWSTSNGTKPISSYTQGVLDKFDDNIEVKYGKKYIKIVGGVSSGVWGFIVNTDDDKKFKKGDLLMAAGYNNPARNHARGNILDGGYIIRWTGPLYMN